MGIDKIKFPWYVYPLIWAIIAWYFITFPFRWLFGNAKRLGD